MGDFFYANFDIRSFRSFENLAYGKKKLAYGKKKLAYAKKNFPYAIFFYIREFLAYVVLKTYGNLVFPYVASVCKKNVI